MSSMELKMGQICGFDGREKKKHTHLCKDVKLIKLAQTVFAYFHSQYTLPNYCQMYTDCFVSNIQWHVKTKRTGNVDTNTHVNALPR